MKKTALVLIILLAALVTGAILGLLALRQPTANTSAQRIYLPQGVTYNSLCDTLVANGVLHSRTAFDLVSRLRGLDKVVRPGSYLVQPHTRTLALVQKLYSGQQDPLRLTIRKFRRPQDLNAYLDKKLMHNDFDVPTDSFHLVLQDTYEVYWTITPDEFMQRMRKEYKRVESGKWKAENDATQGGSPLSSFKEVVILASIVEEETNNQAEKPLIANVYLNRLRRGMPLQADPTVKYAVGDFTLRRILNKHLAVESPFNTYLHTGLPPAPICLPSKATIDAVIAGESMQSNYLYFCASEQMDGTHRFATTLAEHSRNAARFHTALNRHGIR